MNGSEDKIGFIVGEVDTAKFTFVSDSERYPPRHEYLVIPGVRERRGNQFKEVEVLAKVTRLVNYSELMSQQLSLREIELLISKYPADPKVYGEAKILGYLDENGEIQLPRSAAIPGQSLFIAPNNLLENFFSENPENCIEIGKLITRSDVPVRINPNGFRRHVAIIAQTGAGKSYLVGLILEKLLPMGATVVVFDPNSDYVRMKLDKAGKKTRVADLITIYRPPGVEGRRFSNEEIGGAESYTINFSSLELEDIYDLCGILKTWTRIRGAIKNALERLHGFYQPRDLHSELETMAQNNDSDAERALPYVRRIMNFEIWGTKDIPLRDLLRPRKLSVIDLAGVQRDIMQYIVERTLSEVWSRAAAGELDFPLFLVMEEAHNYVPKRNKSRASYIIKRIASEGRKFKVFLLLVTQRPGRVDDDVLSQCNSQIIMRMANPVDMSAVRNAAEALSQDLFQDLPGLNKGEAIVVGELTKIPAMVKITGRTSAEGGSDIDVVEALEKSRKAAEILDSSSSTIEEIRESKVVSEW
jgi:DNA helicase HerA-like ATPase